MRKQKTNSVTADDLIKVLSALFAPALSEDDDSDPPAEPPRGKTNATKSDAKRKKLVSLADRFKEEFTARALKELLEDVADVTSADKVPADKMDDVIEELETELADIQEPESSEVTVEAVKIAIQAFQKKNGKEDTLEILEDYGIKSVRSLDKLEQSQLEDLFADVTED